MKPIFRIDQFEAQQTAWQKLRAAYEQRLQKLRSQLENPATPECRRAELIFRIDELKGLLASDAPPEQTNVAGAGE